PDLSKLGRRHTLDLNVAGEPKPNRPKGLKRAAYKGFPAPSSGVQLFEPRGRLSAVPRVAPVKRPRVTIPLVGGIKATLPVRLFARSTTSSSSSKLKLKCTELQSIKTELAQIKYNIEALLGRLGQIPEEQSPSTDGKKE
uniref:RALY RNA binding protein like n=1 Tax=Vombatus ursinus TaxID=29139 RepID=A0A4X2MC94_VOMUR